MKSTGAVLSLARRVVASVSILSLAACCREVGRFDGSIALGPQATGIGVVDGAVDDASCVAFCRWNTAGRCTTAEVHSCSATTVDGGPGVYCNTTIVECPQPVGSVCGRRTDGIAVAPTTDARDVLGALVALEAEAVAAFSRLASELVALEAPASLVRAARSCAADERRHVAMVSALDGRTAIDAPDHLALPQRGAFAIAHENAVEGCVREAFGVIVAQWQSERSPDPRVRDCYARIARDEAKHAAFAHRLDEWLAAALSEEQRAQLATAKRDALVALREEQRGATRDPWLGTPDATTARALLDALAAASRSARVD
jgi:hypothetical protein